MKLITGTLKDFDFSWMKKLKPSFSSFTRSWPSSRLQSSRRDLSVLVCYRSIWNTKEKAGPDQPSNYLEALEVEEVLGTPPVVCQDNNIYEEALLGPFSVTKSHLFISPCVETSGCILIRATYEVIYDSQKLSKSGNAEVLKEAISVFPTYAITRILFDKPYKRIFQSWSALSKTGCSQQCDTLVSKYRTKPHRTYDCARHGIVE